MAEKFKIVMLRKLSSSYEIEDKELAKFDAKVERVFFSGSTEDDMIAATQDADAILGGGPFLNRRVMESMQKCRVIATYAVGYDGVDVQAATDNGILVVNNPAVAWCVEEVSNHAMTLLLACAKKLILMNSWVKQGKYQEAKRALPPMGCIYGETLGLVGCGDIGRMVAKKAKCFGLKVVGYDPYASRSLMQEYGITMLSLPELLKAADYVSVHTPLTGETRHLMGEKEFRQMKPTAYFINTARGQVVDEPALIKALQEKWVAGAGLDVFEKEPIAPDNPLLKMDNVAVTPHNGSYSDYAVAIQGQNPTQEVIRVLSGRWPKHVINTNVKPRVNLVK